MDTQSFAKFMKRIVSTRRNLIGALTALIIVLFAGIYVMVLPWQIKDWKLEELSAEIESSRSSAITVVASWEHIAKWYDVSYQERFDSNFRSATEMIDTAEWRLKGAKELSSPDDVLASVTAGLHNLEAADEKLHEASLQVVNAKMEKEAATTLLGDTRKRYAQLDALVLSHERAFKSEAAYYPSERVSKGSRSITGLRSNLNVVSGLLLTAERVLPEEGNDSQVGNPIRAIILLSKANERLEAEDHLLAKSKAMVNELRNARLTAQPEHDAANNKIAKVQDHINDVSHVRGYGIDGVLADAMKELNKARDYSKVTADELSIKPSDYVSALANAKAAQNAAEASSNEVKSQIEADIESQRLVEKIQREIPDVAKLNATSVLELEYLAKSHNFTAWSSVSNNAQESKSLLAQIQADHEALKALRSAQNFKQAVEKGNEALEKLKEARRLDYAVAETRLRLEIALASWPSVFSDAQSELSASRSVVVKYLSYSPEAVSLLASAEGALKAAKVYAANREYLAASESARGASEKAKSARRRAEKDYEEEQDRIRRAKAEEERLLRIAQEAAEAASRMQELRDSSSNYDYGGSSSSYDYGGSSDYGSFGGSSGSDYGSFGGSSGGSDYGSFPY